VPHHLGTAAQRQASGHSSSFESSFARFTSQRQAASLTLQPCGDVDFVHFGNVLRPQHDRLQRTCLVDRGSQQAEQAICGLTVDARLFARLDTGHPAGKRFHDQPQGAHIDTHAFQDSAAQGSKGPSLSRVSCPSANQALPASQPTPTPIVGVEQLEISWVIFSTAGTHYPVRPANLDQHVPQRLLVHMVDPAPRLPQFCQRINLVSTLLRWPRRFSRRRPSEWCATTQRLPLLTNRRSRSGVQYLPQDTRTTLSAFATAHPRLPTSPLSSTSGPSLSVPPWIASPSHTLWRQQSLVPYRREPLYRLCQRDKQQRCEYNVPQTWCRFHRPPPLRDGSIYASGRPSCQSAGLTRIHTMLGMSVRENNEQPSLI
jgi:hypothetical protein